MFDNPTVYLEIVIQEQPNKCEHFFSWLKSPKKSSTKFLIF